MMKSGSNLERVLEAGHFAVTAEIGPPKHADGGVIRSRGEQLRGYADAFNLTDNQAAVVRLSSIAAGAILVQQGQDPVIQMTCRDRNRIGLQSDLLGAYALGVRNVLCLSGDHQRFGNHPTAKNVYDLDSINLIQMVKQLRDEKRFLSGEECKIEPRFYIGCAANPFADPFEFRVMRLEKKIAAGADFVQTQCVFDMERFERFMEMVRERGLHKRAKILAGVMPVKSAKAAAFMQQHVAGMMVPDAMVERLKKAEDEKAEGLQLCIEQIKHLKTIEGVAGVHIMTLMWEEMVPFIVEQAGLLPRPEVSGDG